MPLQQRLGENDDNLLLTYSQALGVGITQIFAVALAPASES